MASLQVTDLSKTYSGKIAISHLNFEIPKNRITGLLGPNGAGKTTALRILTGFIRPDNGSVSLDGVSLERDPIFVKQRLGYLPESAPVYPDMSASEYLDFIGQARGLDPTALKKRKKEVLELCDLKQQLHSPASILSKGYKQRLALAGALLHDPELIILDEPSSGLDPIQIQHFRNIIRTLAKDKILLLSTHILSEVEEICDHVLVLHKGSLIADLPVTELKRGNFILLTAKTDLTTLERIFEKKDIKVRLLSRSEEGSEFQLESPNLSPEEIFEMVRAASFPVLEFKIAKRSLENVFQELVSN
ncbi:ABC transporter ATP-binding protein [Leptospira langatensis]|uniref:ABC transporter ATP-binding protein n=1 Tax=Leptospira langatensis TaxID=2484983 RepID=A0A5F1ZPQ6_9LEPT|nr:ABC transporter ATP-binding protein [Leptospira langatensis]TGK05555.1 ABC transporter ATP-binding protein [Leptospira langatensis]TGL38687.1 ABC transporter ATP-binding protein [Leptospira langatensis]